MPRLTRLCILSESVRNATHQLKRQEKLMEKYGTELYQKKQ